MSVLVSRLRDFRLERGWSQGELADLALVSRQTINAIETGRSEPGIRLALALAELFECHVEDIFGLAADPDDEPLD